MENSRKGKKNKIKHGYGIGDYYNFYKENYDNPVDKKLYRKIIKDYHQQLYTEIIEHAYDFKLPFRLGVLCLRKYKPKLELRSDNKLINNNPPDFKKTKELWERDPEAKKNRVIVRHLNRHSNGFVFTFKYFKQTANYKNQTVFQFEPVRKVKQYINKCIKNFKIDAIKL